MAFAVIIVAILIIFIFWHIHKNPVHGLYLTFFATSVLITPSLPVLQEKVAAPEVLIILVWATMLLNPQGWRPGTAPPVTYEQRRSLMLGAAFVAAVFASFFFNNAFFYGSLVASAVETVNYAYGFLMFATVVWLVDDWKKWFNCLVAWICGAALVSFVGVWALTGTAPSWFYDDVTGRISSTLKFSNQVPSFLLPVFPAVAFLAATPSLSGGRRALLALLVLGIAATVLGTGSRTGLGMLVICVLGVLYIAAREARWRVFSSLPITLAVLAVVGGLAAATAYTAMNAREGYRVGETPAWQRGIVMLVEWIEGEQEFDSTREVQIVLALRKLPEFMIFGTGPALFTPRFRSHEVHNTYIGVLIGTGLIGFSLFLGWLTSVALVGLRSARSCVQPHHRLLALALFVGFVALLAYSLTIFGLRQRNIWLLAGLLTALPRLDAPRTRASPLFTSTRPSVDQHGSTQPSPAPGRPDRPRYPTPRPVRRKLPPGRVRPAADHVFPPRRVRPGRLSTHRGGAGRGTLR